MIHTVLSCLFVIILMSMTACVPSWNHTGGPQLLPPPNEMKASEAGRAAGPRKVSFTVPAGWRWFIRGEDLIVTRDGVFLQQIFIERIQVDQVDQDVLGTFWLVAWSSGVWPTRTVKSLNRRFTPAMSPMDAAKVLIGSRENDPAVADLKVRELTTQTVAGHQAFRVVFDFRLKDAVLKASPLYRSIYCGCMVDDWFYGISYTATRRYYFEKDAQTFEAFLQSVRLVAK